jgi:chromate reductase
MKKVHLVGISGSLRQASSNTAILRTLQEALQQDVDMTVVPLNDVPLYNQDLDGPGLPEPVRKFKNVISTCDGLVICSPEYNFGMPGVLKNALDWASRPAFASPLKDKPALLMTASPAFTGGVRAQAQLRDTLTGALARVVATPPVVIAGVHTKLNEGRFVDEANLKFVLDAIDALVGEIRMLRVAKAAVTS